MKRKENLTLLNAQSESGLLFSVFIFLFLTFTALLLIIVSLIKLSSSLIVYLSPLRSALALVITTVIEKKCFSKTKTEKAVNLFRPVKLLMTVILVLGMYLGFSKVHEALINWFSSLGVNTNANVVIASVTDYILCLITVAILPALFEELFFRKILISRISENAVKASIFSGLCFALFHLSITQFLYQFIYGFFLSLLAVKTKSVVYSVIAHFLNNFIILSVQFFKINLSIDSVFITIIGIVFLIVFALWVFPKERSQKQKFYLTYAFASIGIIACIIMAISSL